MIRIHSASAVRALDAKEIAERGITSYELMQEASASVYREIRKIYRKRLRGKRVVALVGFGNNGGDALCVARLLMRDGVDVSVLVAMGKRVSEDCGAAWKDFASEGGKTEELCEKNVKDGDVYLDGLFGSGISRPIVDEGIMRVIEKLKEEKERGCDVIGIDVPSGLGNTEGAIVECTHTIAIDFPKEQSLWPENEKYVGKLRLCDFRTRSAAEHIGENLDTIIYEREDIRAMLPRRPEHGHKGTFGHAMLVAGSEQMPGAAMIAAKAALKSGCGMLTCVIPKELKGILLSYVPEAICLGYGDAEEAKKIIREQVAKMDAVCIGPGITTSEEAEEILVGTLEAVRHNNKGLKIIIDADGLNILAKVGMEVCKGMEENIVLTPHPGEFSRLFCDGERKSRKEMIERQKEAAKTHNGLTILLKGRYTSVCTHNEGRTTLAYNTTGNNGMGTAGSGDALSGVIVSLMAQGMKPNNAAIVGAYIHGLAGDIAKRRETEYGVTATRIVDNMGSAFKTILKRGKLNI